MEAYKLTSKKKEEPIPLQSIKSINANVSYVIHTVTLTGFNCYFWKVISLIFWKIYWNSSDTTQILFCPS